MSGGCQECARSQKIVSDRNGQIVKLNEDLDMAYAQIGRLKAELRTKEARMKGQRDQLARDQDGKARSRHDNWRRGRERSANSIANRLFAGEPVPAEEVPPELHEHPDFVLDRETYTVRATHVVGRQNLGSLLRAALRRAEKGPASAAGSVVGLPAKE